MTIRQRLQEALTAHRQGRLDDASQGYRQVLDQNPEHAEALANLASIHARKSEYQEALACYRKALQNPAAVGELWFNYGNLQQRLSMKAEAASSFEHALRLNPGLYQAHYNWAAACPAGARSCRIHTGESRPPTRG